MRYRRSLIRKGVLKIPIMMVVKKHKASPAVFNKIGTYIEVLHRQSKVQSEMQERSANDNLEEFGPAHLRQASKLMQK